VLVLRRDARFPIIVAAVAVLSGAAGVAPADVPPRSEGGQALVVPQEHLELGEVYHVQPGMGTQFMWRSDAPLLHVAAACNRVVGYVVTPFDIAEGQVPLLAGAFRVPVASLTTGLQRYDQELHGPQALDAATHPEITFRITRAADAKPVSEEKRWRVYTLRVAGELTVKDRTVEIEIPMRLTFAPFTWQTTALGMGDALILRGTFNVPMTKLGLEPSVPTDNGYTAEVVNFELYLLCNTMSPERNLYPNITHEQYRKQLWFLTLVRDFNDPEKGYDFGRAFLREIWEDAQALNRLATAALTEEGIKTRDLGFVREAAERANELTGYKDPELLHTLAQVQFERADLDAALKWARQAVENAEGAAPSIAAEVRAALQRYEAQAQKNRE
jgi:polyisoprenoid-binding protein YceI